MFSLNLSLSAIGVLLFARFNDKIGDTCVSKDHAIIYCFDDIMETLNKIFFNADINWRMSGLMQTEVPSDPEITCK